MPFASSLTTETDSPESVSAALSDQIANQLANQSTSLVLLFSSGNWNQHLPLAAQVFAERLGCDAIIGCTGESIIEGRKELELESGLAAFAAAIDGVNAVPFHLNYQRSADGGSFDGLPEELLGPWKDPDPVLLLADPFSFPTDVFLNRWNDDRPGTVVVGGMASADQVPGKNHLVLGNAAYREGAVGLVLQNYRGMSYVVSQGCRPIGAPHVITRCERNKLFELGGKSALSVLQSTYAKLANHEQALLQKGLHLGVVVNEQQEEFEQGDFLIRNVAGIDQDDGAIVIGEYLRVGQTVQFHLRDESTADSEMKFLLARQRDQNQSAGALVFTCNGRGQRLFENPDHDALLVQETLGDIPAAGFFAAGEIGAIGGKNFVHGFTASIAVFAEP